MLLGWRSLREGIDLPRIVAVVAVDDDAVEQLRRANSCWPSSAVGLPRRELKSFAEASTSSSCTPKTSLAARKLKRGAALESDKPSSSGSVGERNCRCPELPSERDSKPDLSLGVLEDRQAEQVLVPPVVEWAA